MSVTPLEDPSHSPESESEATTRRASLEAKSEAITRRASLEETRKLSALALLGAQSGMTNKHTKTGTQALDGKARSRHTLGESQMGRSGTEKHLLAKHEQGQKHRSKVFDPSKGFMKGWDSCVACALLFTAAITPFEIGFLDTAINAMFVLNRVVDVVFFVDIYINLKLAYFDANTGWVYDPSKCMRRYLRSWFAIDVISLIPWDVITYIAEESGGGGGNMKQLKMLRLLKILKITKLVRMAKAVRIFKRIATTLNMSNTSKMLLTYIVLIVVVTHWIACAWGLVARLLSDDKVHDSIYYATEGGRLLTGSRLLKSGGAGDTGEASGGAVGDTSETLSKSWVARAEQDLGTKLSTADIYSICLEYSLSIMCMGYGTVEPTNATERWFSICCLLSAGSLYAYVVGGICAAVATEDPAIASFKENMDMLMLFFHRHSVSDDMRVAAYDYLNFSKELLQDRCHQQVHYMLYSIYCTLYTIHYTLYTIHYTLYTVHYTAAGSVPLAGAV
jgi:potassium voltage-gated channel Eag-related subfamily H protein 7